MPTRVRLPRGTAFETEWGAMTKSKRTPVSKRRKEEPRQKSSAGRCYIPSDGPDAWQTFLADPSKQWKTGYSAKTLAHSWEADDRLPDEIVSLIRTIPRYKREEPELLMAMPEWKVPLPGGRRPSQNDVLALIGVGDDLMVAAVEGKVSESFGDTIESWFAEPSEGRRVRLQYLCGLLGMVFPPDGNLRYQLFHRAASAVIESRRFRARTPAMIVHSFSPNVAGLEDYKAFVETLGGSPDSDEMSEVNVSDGGTLLLGWASGDESYLNA